MTDSKSHMPGNLQSPLITASCLKFDSEFNRTVMFTGVSDIKKCWGDFITDNELTPPQNISRWRFAWEEYVLKYNNGKPRKQQRKRRKISDSSSFDSDIWNVQN